MKEIIIKYKTNENAYPTGELRLVKYMDVVIKASNDMITTSRNMKQDCPIKVVSDVRWDIQRCINQVKDEIGKTEKFDFRIEVKPDHLNVMKNGSELFAVIKEDK